MNLTDGEVLTLEKMQERVEFEAFVMPGSDEGNKDVCVVYVECVLDCKELCPDFTLSPCSCDGPVGYIPCHPYRG